MQKIYCDRCKKETGIIRYTLEVKKPSIPIETLDLCPACYVEFKKWLDEIKQT